jgi:hypothetical protein
MRALLIPTQLRAREIGIHRRSRTPHLPSQRLKDGIRSPVSSRRIKVVGRAEFESATFWVVTRCSNPIELPAGKYLRELGLNQRPWAYETPALPLSYLAVKGRLPKVRHLSSEPHGLRGAVLAYPAGRGVGEKTGSGHYVDIPGHVRIKWYRVRDSSPRHPGCKPGALTRLS